MIPIPLCVALCFLVGVVAYTKGRRRGELEELGHLDLERAKLYDWFKQIMDRNGWVDE